MKLLEDFKQGVMCSGLRFLYHNSGCCGDEVRKGRGAGSEVRRPTGDAVISWVMGTVGSMQGTARGDRTELKDVGHLVGQKEEATLLRRLCSECVSGKTPTKELR